MWKKLLILSLSIAVLFVFSAPISSVNAGGKKNKLNWRIAGTIVQFIDINELIVPPAPPYFKSVGMHSLINLSAQGSPGPAKITLLSQTGPIDGSSECISLDYIPVANFVKNDFIALFPDQSLLFASIDDSVGGTLCMGIAGTAVGTTYFKVKMIIKGGTGRFEDVTGGEFEAEGYGYPGFSSDTTLVGENGRIKGTIEFD